MNEMEWINQFPKAWRGAIGNWFYNAVRNEEAPGVGDAKRLCSAVWTYLQEHPISGSVDKQAVLKSMKSDSEGAIRFMTYVIQRDTAKEVR